MMLMMMMMTTMMMMLLKMMMLMLMTMSIGLVSAFTQAYVLGRKHTYSPLRLISASTRLALAPARL